MTYATRDRGNVAVDFPTILLCLLPRLNRRLLGSQLVLQSLFNPFSLRFFCALALKFSLFLSCFLGFRLLAFFRFDLGFLAGLDLTLRLLVTLLLKTVLFGL